MAAKKRYTVTPTNATDSEGNVLSAKQAPYSKFMLRHPDYDAKYWERLVALYRGGRFLLGNDKLMREIFPKHRKEHDDIYKERKDCAHYITYAAEIVGNTVTGACSDPLSFRIEGKEELPTFYSEFIDDTSRPGKKTKCSLAEFAYDRLLSALIRGKSYAQVDLPRVEGEFDSKLEEEKAKADRCYLVAVDRDAVIDWGVDDDDELEWAITMKVSNKREGPDGDRAMFTEEYTVMDADSYQVWQITYKEGNEPNEKSMVTLIDEGPHSFGQVPLICFDLPENLWSMDKMESACRALLRDLNSMLWNYRQNCHPQLYEFLAAEFGAGLKPIGINQENPSRAVNQTRGEGYVQVRGGEDKAMYVGPGMESSIFGKDLVGFHRDEMYRINNQMSHSTDMKGQSIRRSAESKELDVDKEEALFKEVGRHLKIFLQAILGAAQHGRREPEALEGLHIGGIEKFNKRSTEAHIDSALLVQSMNIQSPTFDRAMKMDVVRTHLADVLTKEEFAVIQSELEKFIKEEDFANRLPSPEEIAAAVAKNQMDDDEEEDDEDENEDEDTFGG